MKYDIAGEIAALVDRFSMRLPAEKVVDARDWVREEESSVAVEVLSDALHSAGIRLNQEEWVRMDRVVKAMGGSAQDYSFIAPIDSEAPPED